MHSLVQKILDTCERVANLFLHPGANYMYNLHTVCKSAHVNGAYVNLCLAFPKGSCQTYMYASESNFRIKRTFSTPLFPVNFRWIPFSGSRGEVKNVSANQSPGRSSLFSDRPE